MLSISWLWSRALLRGRVSAWRSQRETASPARPGSGASAAVWPPCPALPGGGRRGSPAGPAAPRARGRRAGADQHPAQRQRRTGRGGARARRCGARRRCRLCGRLPGRSRPALDHSLRGPEQVLLQGHRSGRAVGGLPPHRAPRRFDEVEHLGAEPHRDALGLCLLGWASAPSHGLAKGGGAPGSGAARRLPGILRGRGGQQLGEADPEAPCGGGEQLGPVRGHRDLEVKLTHGTPSARHRWRTRCSKRLDCV